MPLSDSDISWQVLRQIIHDWAGSDTQIAEVRPLEGGCINTTLCITTNKNERVVLKIAQHRVNREFERERAQLDLMRKCDIPVPKVFAQKTASLDSPDSFILMEFIDGVDLAEAKKQCADGQFDRLQSHLAGIVARLHDEVGDAYQRVAHHEGKRYERWPDFFRYVYDAIWHECEKTPHLPIRARKQIGRIHDQLDRLLATEDKPRLVHWDIWSTNILCRADESGEWKVAAMLDPNCKYAHAEAEIAYMELFHTVTPAFLHEYQNRHKLDGEYHRSRKWIYQLYPMIDHVVLFGEQYLKPLLNALDHCAALV